MALAQVGESVVLQIESLQRGERVEKMRRERIEGVTRQVEMAHFGEVAEGERVHADDAVVCEHEDSQRA